MPCEPAEDEPPSSGTQFSIIYSGNPDDLQAFLQSKGRRDFFHPSIEVKHSPIAGRGLFATALIRKGELISHEDPADYLILNREQVECMSLENQDFWWHFCYQVGDDAWMGPRSREVVARKKTFFTNHSCDPSTWFIDDITMIARRTIHPGDEITYDYSTTESYIDPEMETVVCRCGIEDCRGRINATDWQRPDLQERYGPHWMSYLQEKIQVQRWAQVRQERSDESSESSDSESPRSSVSGSPLLSRSYPGFKAIWSAAASYPGHVKDESAAFESTDKGRADLLDRC